MRIILSLHSEDMLSMERHHSFLDLLCKASGKQRNAVLKTATKSQLLFLAEVIHNYLKGVIPTVPAEVKIFSGSKHILRRLALKSTVKQKPFIIKHSAFIALFLNKILPKFKR